MEPISYSENQKFLLLLAYDLSWLGRHWISANLRLISTGQKDITEIADLERALNPL
jgi:hypothetical protein